ncbi:MAG: universal stress protein [Desulfobacterales bacterium]|jgi:nucleotide-binding universal stress UspA family protein
MGKEKSVLFGIDDSDFARQALLELGGLLKNSENLKMTIFHGTSEPDFSIFSESIGQDPDAVEKHRERWDLEAQKVLEKAKKSLIESGFDPGVTATIFEKKCSAPSDTMLRLAGHEGIETLAVARWGKTTVSRQVIGSVTYRLSQLADDLALWVIDPRICSHNVLVGLVGAPISQRVVDYTVRYFSHLKESRFTFIHVIPPIPPQYWESEGIADIEGHEKQEKIVLWLKEYTERVKEVANDAKKKLIEAGVPEQNVVFKLEPQKKGIARDIVVELEEGNHGILVLGRKGYKDIKEFGLGSKANKLLINGRAFIVCLVN